jgi:hypothetical protein
MPKAKAVFEGNQTTAGELYAGRTRSAEFQERDKPLIEAELKAMVDEGLRLNGPFSIARLCLPENIDAHYILRVEVLAVQEGGQ